MNKNQIIAEIIQWIEDDRRAENLEPITLTAKTLLLEQLVFDSLKILQFVNWLEQNYAVVIGIENMTASFFASPESIATQLIKQKMLN